MHRIQDLRHSLNPLHVYCRLCDLGMAGGRALLLCKAYERYLYRLFNRARNEK